MPAKPAPNADNISAFGLAPDFLQKNTASSCTTKKVDNETSDLAAQANVASPDVQRRCVITQNLDRNIPRTSAIDLKKPAVFPAMHNV
jgi:hypothetical protein